MSNDPFDVPPKAKTISWKGAPTGATITGIVEGPASKVQGTDLKTGEPAKWDNGNPKYSAVVNMLVKGKHMALWATIPSALFAALKKAQDEALEHFDTGGELSVTFTGFKPASNPKLNPARQFEAKYVPPTEKPAPPEDPWSGDESGYDDEPPF